MTYYEKNGIEQLSWKVHPFVDELNCAIGASPWIEF